MLFVLMPYPARFNPSLLSGFGGTETTLQR